VVDDARARDAAEVPAEVVAGRAVRRRERLERLPRELMDLERLVLVELGEAGSMPEGRDHEVAGRVRELVQERERAPPAVDDEPLLVVALGSEAEDAALLLVGRLDVLETPRRPQRLRHDRVFYQDLAVRSLRAPSALLTLGLLVLVSTLLRFWAATRIPTPWIAPDELIYAELSRSLWEHGTLHLLGRPTSFFSFVYPALAGGPLSLRDVHLGYTLLKELQALLVSLTAIPVFLWGRSFVSPRLALAAAALAVAIPDLAYSGLILTDVALYPVLVLAAWASAAVLARPTLARQGLLVAAIGLAAATRLQAAVLVPAFVTAVGVKALLDRELRWAVRLWPTFAGFAALGAGWAAWQLRNGGPASKLFGAYQAAGEIHYSFGDAVRFCLYHAGDVLLFTGVVPICALAVLLAVRPAGAEARAYLAVAVSMTVWLVAEVGVFASRHVGHLAERNLFALAPILFLALALWLDRGAPRPLFPTAAAVVGALLLVAYLPMARLVTAATIPDALTLIPLHRLHVHAPGLGLRLVAIVLAAVAAAAFALVPRRLAWLLPAALLAVFAAASVSASRVVAAEATLVQPGTVGAHPRWIDEHADGPVAYLYTGDVYWNSVWESLFWNRRLDRVYDLLLAAVPGGIPQDSLGPYGDGRLVDKFGHGPRVSYVVASDSLLFAGRRIADAGNGISLWRVDPPFRLRRWTQNVRFDGTVERHAKLVVYGCRGGTFRLTLQASAPRRITLLRNERRYASAGLRPGSTSTFVVPAEAPRPLGRHLCTLDLLTNGPVLVRKLDVT
jgi:hypothetical protein